MSKQRTIGIVIGNANSPHTKAVIDGINAATKELKINQLTMINVQADSIYQKNQGLSDKKHGLNPVFNMIDYAKLDGILVSYGTLTNYISDDERVEFLQYIRDIPHVMMEAEIEIKYGSSVTGDNYAGMYALVDHLIKVHHRTNLTCLAGPATNDDSNLRLKGFLDALEKNGLDADPRRVVHGDYTPWVQSQISDLHSRFPDLDAMVCGNDHMAYTAEQYFQDCGFQIGTDISITGYDDWSVAEYMPSPLSTVSQNSYKMGYDSVHELIHLLDGEAPTKIRIPSRPIFRASCGCEYHSTNSSLTMHEAIASYEEQFSSFRQQTWQLPLISNSMMDNMSSDESFYREAVAKLYSLGSRHSFLFAFTDAIKISESGDFIPNKPLELVAVQHWDKTHVFEKDKRSTLESQDGFMDFFSQNSSYNLCVFSLMADDILYGFLALDISSEQIALFHAISLQLSNTLRYYDLAKVQLKTQKELEFSINELAHKNEMISHISEYDTLTSIYNRRGFMEAVFNYTKENPGCYVILLFADLDHLKAINDQFGHTEGDFALKETARLLKSALPKGSILGRIGGDEYVALFDASLVKTPEDVMLDVSTVFNEYNERSSINYYIELSLGYTSFICSNEISIGEYMDQADQKLYIAKKTRRDNIVKLRNKEGKYPFTGLPLESSVKEFFRQKILNKEPFSGYALHFDIDDMRGINASLGIDKGDEALQITVDCIQSTMRENQTLYRIGGDEFLLIDSSNCNYREGIYQFYEIRKNINRYLMDHHYELSLSVSCGIAPIDDALIPDPYRYLLNRTRFTLTKAKGRGSNAWYAYNKDEFFAFLGRKNLLVEMRNDLTHAGTTGRSGFHAFYQPLYDNNQNLIGAETLMRYTSPKTKSMIPPSEFIPLLESSGLIIPASFIMMDAAFKFCKKMQEYIPNFKISINVSPVQIQKSEVAEDILRRIGKNHLDPSCVIVELTESRYLEEDERFHDFWRKLSLKNVILALDDFGTGYSNFHYLNKLKPAIIKFDYTFTNTALKDEFEFQLLKNTVDLIKNLNLSVCIEGIEDEVGKEKMMSLSPNYCQGYLFGKPVPKDYFYDYYIGPYLQKKRGGINHD